MGIAAYKHLSAYGIKYESCDFSKESLMEAYLLENPSILSFENLKCNEILSSQSPWNRKIERQGRIDLLVSYENSIAIVELKKGELVEDDYKQIVDYFENLPEKIKNSKVLRSIFNDDDIPPSSQWFGVLVGTKATPDFLSKFSNKKLHGKYPFGTIVMSRFKSDNGLFVITDTYNPDFNVRSRDKFIFNNTTFPQYKIIAVLFKDYCDNKNKNVTISELEEFAKMIGLWYKPIVPREIIQNKVDEGKTSGSNYFMNEYIITLNDGVKYIIANYMDSSLLDNVMTMAKAMGYTDEIKLERK